MKEYVDFIKINEIASLEFDSTSLQNFEFGLNFYPHLTDVVNIITFVYDYQHYDKSFYIEKSVI